MWPYSPPFNLGEHTGIPGIEQSTTLNKIWPYSIISNEGLPIN